MTDHSNTTNEETDESKTTDRSGTDSAAAGTAVESLSRRRLLQRSAVGAALVGASGAADTGILSDVPAAVGTATAQSSGFTQQAKLGAVDSDDAAFFGRSVTLSGSGDTVLIGAPTSLGGDIDSDDPGSVHVFTRDPEDTDTWLRQTRLSGRAAEFADGFGMSVAMSGGEEKTAVFGAPYDNSTGEGDDDHAGSAYVFTGDVGDWSQQSRLLAPDREPSDAFGTSVAVSESGDTAVVGAIREDGVDQAEAGSAYVFTRDGETWNQRDKITAGDSDARDQFGISVATSDDGETILVGAWNDNQNGEESGSAYVFTRDEESWTQQAKIVADDGASEDNFGLSVTLSGAGDTAMVGAYRNENANGEAAGAVYVFARDNGSWSQQTKLVADDGDRNDLFGRFVTLSGAGETAVIGAPNDGDPNGRDELGGAGAAYVFDWDGSEWTQQTKVAADDGEPGDAFGVSTAVSDAGGTAAIGALNDTGPEILSGSTYIFSSDDDSGGGGDDDPPEVVDGSPVQDPDDDGHYEDIDGNGEVDIFDVRTLFNNLDQPVVQDNPEYFDFDDSQDGQVDIFDVRALFNELN